MKMKKSARRRHCSKIFKTNLKSHISPLLNRPQGCQGCQKNWKDLDITAMICFAANFQPNLKKIWKITKKQAYFDNFCWFWRLLCNSFNFGWILVAISLSKHVSGLPWQARQWRKARFGPCLDFGFQNALIRNNWSKKFWVEYWTLPGSNTSWWSCVLLNFEMSWIKEFNKNLIFIDMKMEKSYCN